MRGLRCHRTKGAAERDRTLLGRAKVSVLSAYSTGDAWKAPLLEFHIPGSRDKELLEL